MTGQRGGFRILHVSDVHATVDGDLYGTIDGARRLRDVARFVQGGHLEPQVIVITGDLIERGNPGAYATVRDAIAGLEHDTGLPVLPVIGNHDDRAVSESITGAGPGEGRFVTVTDVRFVLLDSSDGAVGAGQRSWLADLLATPFGAGTVVALHHPPVPSPLPGLGHAALADSTELLDVLAGSDVRAVLAGHYHHPLTAIRRGIPITVAPSLAYHQVMSEPPGQVSGYDQAMAAIVELLPDGVTSTPFGLDTPPPLFTLTLSTAQHSTNPHQ